MATLAACISDGVCVNVAVYDGKTSAAWLKDAKKHYDDVLLVDVAAVGWIVGEDGLRPESPFPSWSWDGSNWVPPVPVPDGVVYWDEETTSWVEL